ncbi:Piso0_000770 [Millerozyma farinosa CBS 7064]|uniref:Piso0_000770 protein n=1 Tax=Pichia sorbitophila (strain ATCC MYA-4447 / BCRC 22081 / CBS 7064 / NBRC 10061 / NRRL Y-12695) TaxID=559304 RepID=G8YRG7_PICSO|nr:Piso0_000770 [Millerozyma farinosa CBS 7064]
MAQNALPSSAIFKSIRREIFPRFLAAKRQYSVVHKGLDATTKDKDPMELKQKDREWIKIEDILTKRTCSGSRVDILSLMNEISTYPEESLRDLRRRLDEMKYGETKEIRDTMTLQCMLGDTTVSNQEIFAFIADRCESLQAQIIEVFLARLLSQGLLNNATSLLHICFKKVKDFTLSNEMWSLFTCRVCEFGHYLGSCLIYHELIDNHTRSEENYPGSLVNASFLDAPFLLSPNQLSYLGIVFQRHNDSLRIEGLLLYFKTYYSYLGHRETYKSLKFSLLEATSSKGNLDDALDIYRSLVKSFHGYYKKAPYSEIRKNAMVASFDHFRERRDNIKHNNVRIPDDSFADIENSIDILEESSAKNFQLDLYKPFIEENIFSRPHYPSQPLISGVIKVNDLPVFTDLLKANIEKLMKSPLKEKIGTLHQIVSDSHFSLYQYILRALSDLGYLKESLVFLQRIPILYPKVKFARFFSDQDFLQLYFHIKNLLLMKSSGYDNSYSKIELYDIFIGIKNFHDMVFAVHNSSKVSSKYYEGFFSTFVYFPYVDRQSLVFYIDTYTQRTGTDNLPLYFNETDYNKIMHFLTDDDMKNYHHIINKVA